MLDRAARLAIAAPKRILAVVVLVTALCGAFGATAQARLLNGGQLSTDSESARASDLLAQHFDQERMDLTLLVRTPAGVDDPAAAEAGKRLAARLGSAPHVRSVVSPWTAPGPVAKSLTSKDGKSALVVATVEGGEDRAPANAKAVAEAVSGTRDGLAVVPGGVAIVQAEIVDQGKTDLLVMEAIAVPLSLLALVLVFGGLYAALLPLVVGGVAIAGTLAELRLLTTVTPVSTYAMNLTTAIALALGIDYTLLLVSRYREECQRCGDRDEALRTAVGKAGRTVLFSSVTVILALSALTVFPVYFLRSMAYAGIGVVVVAAAATVLVAPALIAVLGDRIEALDLRAGLRRLFARAGATGEAPAQEPGGGERRNFWHRSAKLAMRHAVVALAGGVAALALLGAPFVDARFGTPTDRVLPHSSSARQVGDAVRAQFRLDPSDVISIVVSDADKAGAQELSRYADRLSRAPWVLHVNAPDGAHADGKLAGPPAFGTGSKDGLAWLTVVKYPSVRAFSTHADQQLRALRAVPPPDGAHAQFTGQEQIGADATAVVLDKLPLVGALIALSSFVLLFLLTGSVVLPVKSLALNLLSLAAALGASVWVFQQGHLGGLGTTATGALVLNMLVFMFVLAFGLSMDYEVFIVSRIREHWLASGQTPADNEESVALGIATSGRVVTAAAMLMCVVFAAMCSAQISFMRMFGICLVLAVGMDATLVRIVLVPAFMRLAGRWNWWSPGPLARLHERIGLSEDGQAPHHRHHGRHGRGQVAPMR
ncbi:MAG: MMPL family transporter [Segniliparus sp.]|uniref:MMPL family transporter n=1 Tax=Segniliparus sp. TaxID=2804064 RepID=UPI003F348A1B